MRQLTFVRPGLLEWWEAPEPKLQGPDEAIVRPIAVARCDLDAAIVAGKAPFAGPFPFGHEFVAEVVSVGERVAGFHDGQQVVVPFHISCGQCVRCRRGLTASCLSVPPRSMYGLGPVGGDWGGALSDLVRVPFAQGMLVPVPDGVESSAIASLGDNLTDAWRTVGPYLQESPDATVLVVGGGAWSIGLYAAAIACALGASRVDYVDADPERQALATSVGATPIEGPPPRRLGPYPITVDASADPAGLACALRSVEPGGVCTSVGIYFAQGTRVPLLDMYDADVTFKTGRSNAGAFIPSVLELVQSGRLHPERVTTKWAGWEEAPQALCEPSTKVVVLRERRLVHQELER
jgi:alcohol dehydrogenase